MSYQSVAIQVSSNKIQSSIHEISVLSSLRDPAVATFYGWYFSRSSKLCLVFEQMAESLEQWREGFNEEGGPHKLPEQFVLKLCLPIMSAVKYIHQKGIIHRNISLNNIMISPDFSSLALVWLVTWVRMILRTR